MIKQHYQTATKLPNAWITSTHDRGRKSIKNGKVYLNNGSEFLIELHNPLTSCILCDIKLNGNFISKGGLVLKPGQRFYLDCFPDDKKKFVFNTYEVENTNESKAAIAQNGLLEVRFYKEEVNHYCNRNFGWPNSTCDWYSSGSFGSPDYTIPIVTNYTIFGSPLSNTISGQTINTPYLDNINTINTSYCATPQQLNIETGRVEKGVDSSQIFTETDMQFQAMCICSVILQILPESRRPIDTSEIIQTKHKEIIDDLLKGKKESTKLNFCPECGIKLGGGRGENFCQN
jgi:hypothetical protein